MKLQRLKCKYLTYAKDFAVSPSYIIGCTGQHAVILDRQYQLVRNIEGLNYVYSAKVSPDEKNLLLISNENKFYVVNLENFQTSKTTVRSPYDYNLEGIGCWSFDGKSVLIPVTNRKSLNSALRCYQLENLTEYQDFLADQYVICQIHRRESAGDYLMVCYKRQEDSNSHFFLYFDGEGFREYPLENPGNMVMFDSELDQESGIVTLYTSDGCLRYTGEGIRLDFIRHPNPADKTVSFSEVFEKTFAHDPAGFAEIREMFDALGLEHVPVTDRIHKLGRSSCGRYVYIASESGFYAADAKSREVLAEVREQFGVQNFAETAEDVIALSTWSGVKLYQMVNEETVVTGKYEK